MNRFLLDTHILIWWLNDSPQLKLGNFTYAAQI